MSDTPTALQRAQGQLSTAQRLDAAAYGRAAQIAVVAQAEAAHRQADALERIADALSPEPPARARTIEVHPAAEDGSVLITDHMTGRSVVAQPGNDYQYGDVKITVEERR